MDRRTHRYPGNASTVVITFVILKEHPISVMIYLLLDYILILRLCDQLQIRVFRPPNYSGTVGLGILIVIIGGGLYLKRNNLDFMYNKNLWGFCALVSIYFFSISSSRRNNSNFLIFSSSP